MVSSFSLAEFGANVDKIHKKACLILLEAECFKLEQGKKGTKNHLRQKKLSRFLYGRPKSKTLREKNTHGRTHTFTTPQGQNLSQRS